MSNTNQTQNSLTNTVVEKLLNLENSELLKIANSAIEYGNACMDKLDEKYQIDQLTVEQYLSQISPNIDEQIIKYWQSTNQQPLGGEIKLSKNNTDDNVLIVWDFYFSDNNKKIHKIGSQKVMDKSFFTSESYENILKNPVFDITPPKK